MRHATAIALLTALAVVCAAAPVVADGGIFMEPLVNETGETADQRAIILFEEGRQRVLLQTRYEGDVADFAWLIPSPGQPRASDVSLVENDDIATLARVTSPQVVYYSPAGPLCGCFPGGLAGDGGQNAAGDERLGEVTVWDTTSRDGYTAVILSATTVEALVAWLTSKGYTVPDAANSILQDYVSRNWFFTAVRVDGEQAFAEATPRQDGAAPYQVGMTALQMEYRTSVPTFPLLISQVSTRSEAEVLLFVVAPYRVASSNFTTVDMREPQIASGQSPQQAYDQAFDALVATPTLVVEYAGDMSSYLASQIDVGTFTAGYVTRFRTKLSAAAMDKDILFEQAASDDDLSITIMAQAEVEPRTVPRVVLASSGMLLAAGSITVRRRRRLGGSGILSALLLLLIAA
jgi:hypothetical protein